MSDLTKYYGVVRKCEMCLPKVNVHGNFCSWCFGRGYLATCLNCDGKGKLTVPVAGSVGEMESTCTLCGGKGTFPASEKLYLERTPNAVVEPEKEGKELISEVSNSEKQRLIVPETHVEA